MIPVSFCGDTAFPKNFSMTGTTSKECYVDMTSVLLNSIMVLTSFALLIWIHLMKGTNKPTESVVVFQEHTSRWILNLCLMVVTVTELAEGTVAHGRKLQAGHHLHLIVTPLVATISAVQSIFFYHQVERNKMAKLLVLLLAYWPLASCAKFAKIFILYESGYNIHHLRLQLTWATLVIFLLLCGVELTVLLQQKYLSKKKARGPIEVNLSNILYRHHYSTLISKATFYWLVPLLRLGYQRPLEMEDLGKLPDEETAEYQFTRFYNVYLSEKNKSEQRGKTLSLWKCYLRTFYQTLFMGGIIKIVGDLVGLVGPLSITIILAYINDVTSGELPSQETRDYRMSTIEFLQNGYVMACIVLLATFLQSTFSNNFNHMAIAEGVHLRTALQSLIYRKSLRMTTAGLDVGEVVNHMSVDAFNMMMLFSMGHYIWAVPFKIILLLVLLYLQLGYSAVIGAATIYVLSPLQYKVCTLLSRIQKESMRISDERLKRTSELLQGIKLLKLYGWESMYAKLVNQVREKELQMLKKDAIYVALNTFITQASSILVTLVTFAIYSEIEGKPITPAEVFTGLALFNQLTVPLYIIPFVIPIVINATVSTKRLSKFLNMPEVESNVPWRDEELPAATVEFKPDSGSVLLHLKDRETERLNSPFNFEDSTDGVFLPEFQNHISGDGAHAVSVQDGRFTWNVEGMVPVLRDINVQVPTGKLTVVVGPVGCGKTSLLSALLGEMAVMRGLVKWHSSTHDVAYVPQKPWLLNATFKENILFGQTYDGRRYHQIIQACALQPDIDLLPAKDMTEIGERGVNLSGGQRQRIALARAFYSQARTLILDDPLSALDAQVCSHVFENGIKTLLLRRHRTVILVTNKMEHLTQASKIIVLENGKIKHQGTYSDIETASPELVKSWKAIILEKVLNKQHIEEGTVRERNKLYRLLSRQVLYRCGSKQELRLRPRFVSLSRQMSCDPSSPLPCHDWSDNEFSWPTSSDTSDRIGTTRLEPTTSSSDSLNTKSGGSSSSGVFLRHSWKLKPPSRLNSRISGHTSDLIEEEDEDGDETDDLKNTSQGSGMKLETLLPEGKLMIMEDRERGKISRKVYLSYMRACSLPMALGVIFLIIATQAVKVVTDFWLSKWSESGNTTANETLTEVHVEDTSIHSYLVGYAIFSAVSIVLSLITNLTAQLTSLNAVRSLHENMLQNIVHCPMKFFDTTPVGRVLNRFSTDINTIDKKLPITLPMLLRFLLLCVSAIIVDIVVTPYFLLIIVPILAIYFFLQHFFRFTSREIQRIDSVSKSPIFAHFTETLSGLTTIRAFREEKRFVEQLNTCINMNNAAFVLMNCANCWLGVALDYLGGIILFVATISAMTAAIYGHVSLSFVGMSMTYTLLVPIYLNWVVRNLANVEMYMSAVERVQAYTSLPVEAFTGLNAKVPKNWPVVGEIKFEGVTLKYDTAAEPVLRNVTLTITPGQKVGICGRTGNGKSSLVMALFRMLTIIEGKILIDGIDITTLPLVLLRSRLSIIPQDTVLFSGTIRENLDPGSEFSDEELWTALEIAQLKDVVQFQHEGLESEVTEEGSNFSIGQRQLFCLARAILRKSSILVMDEATSSLDTDTDEILQSVVSSHCKDCTILTIAHRVSSLLNYDRVIVLDGGRIAEDGKPSQLMELKGSIFSSLVKASQST